MNELEIKIVDTVPAHLRLMTQAMKGQLRTTAFRLGISPQKALWLSYKQSIFCKAAFVNGEIAAIWGCGGNVVDEKGHPWLVCSPVVEDYPFRVMFVFRRELEKMQRMFPILEDFVDESDKQATKMLELTGFMIGDKIYEYGELKLRKATRVA